MDRMTEAEIKETLKSNIKSAVTNAVIDALEINEDMIVEGVLEHIDITKLLEYKGNQEELLEELDGHIHGRAFEILDTIELEDDIAGDLINEVENEIDQTIDDLKQ